MKRKVSIFCLLIIATSMLLVNSVYAEEIAFDAFMGFDIATSTFPWQATTVYSNYTKMFYAWFQYDRIGVDDIVYVWSNDGINWSPYIEFLTADFGISTGGLDVYVEPNGRYIHWAINRLLGPPHMIYYGKYELFSNGTMEPVNGTAEYQVVLNTLIPIYDNAFKNIDVFVDNESIGYIAFTTYDYSGGWESACLIRSDYPMNGTWATGDYTLYEAQADVFGNLWDDNWHTTITSNGDGINGSSGVGRGVHWFIAHESSLFSNQEIYQSARNYFDGGGWYVDSLTGSTLQDNEGGDWADDLWDMASIGNVTIIFKQTENIADICASYGYRVGTNGWSNRIVIETYAGEDAGSVQIHPKVAIDYNRNIVFAWSIHHPDNDTVWYRQGYVEYNGTITWYTDVVEWESWDTLDVWTNNRISSGMSELLPSNVPMSMTYSDIVADYIYHDYIFPDENAKLVLDAEHYNTTLINQDGSVNDGWIFEGDIYTFTSYFSGGSLFYLNFTDGQHDIKFEYDNSTGYVTIYEDGIFVIGDIFTNYTLYDDGTQKVIWRFVPDINIVDISNTTVDYYVLNSTSGYNVTGYTGMEFNIYNLGGFTYYTFVGDGGRTVGGGPFELYATDGSLGSTARAEQVFRKLQHINFLIEIDMDHDWDNGNGEFNITNGVGYVDVGFDYRLNGTWVDGFFIRLYDQDANVGHHNGAIDHDWIEWSVDFYNYDPTSGNQQNLASQLIYSNHWGYEHENYIPDYYNRTSAQLWVDLWFDMTNASTTVASQVNAYYYGVREQGSAWWFGYGTFTPMISDYDNAKFLDDLYDEGGNITNVQKFDLIKFYIEVGKVNMPSGNAQTWTITNIEDMHREQAIDRMGGIDEPTFVQTKVLDMPQTGFINAIKSAINGLSKLIWGGAFQFIKLLMGAIGSFMEAIGLGALWTAFNTIVGEMVTYAVLLIDDIQVAMLNSALLLTQIQNIIALTIGRYIYFITAFIGSIISWYQEIVNMFTGGGIFSLDIWTGLSLSDWFGLGMTLLPVWWLNRLGKSDNLLDTLKSDIQFASSMTTGVFKFFISLIMLTIALVDLLFGLLPI